MSAGGGGGGGEALWLLLCSPSTEDPGLTSNITARLPALCSDLVGEVSEETEERTFVRILLLENNSEFLPYFRCLYQVNR